ncbi:hypothetical protein [Nesterenkonia pannonica]|nr:IclR family transcriptional regulator C-terminal domain-containing protein [Nesterenkonia pannonica]
MSEDFVERLVAAGVPRLTSKTPTTVEEIRAIQAQVKSQGHAVGNGLVHPDARGIAVPIRSSDGAVVAALGVVVANDDE